MAQPVDVGLMAVFGALYQNNSANDLQRISDYLMLQRHQRLTTELELQ